MKTIILFCSFFIFGYSNAQQKMTPPLFNSKDNFNELFKKFTPFFMLVLEDSALKKYSKFVLLSFEITENGEIKNIVFSKDFPHKITEPLTSILESTNSYWTPASINGFKIRKTIIQPIIFEKGNGIDKNFDLGEISENLNLFGVKYYDALILPVLYNVIQQ